jgi:hypothetical protein
MSQLANKSFFYLALAYLLVVVLESISWPLGNLFFFENALFVPAFLFAIHITIKEKGSYLPIFIIAIIAFISFATIELIASKSFIIGHFLYLLRWLKYAVVFVLAQYFSNSYKHQGTWDFVKTLFLIIVGFNVVILTNPFDLGSHLQSLHAPKDYFNLSNFHEPGVFRLGGTFTNPNDNGIFFSLFFILFAFHSRLKNHYFSALALCMVVFSQSRTAILMCIIIILVSFFYRVIHTRITMRQWFKTSAISLLAIGLFTFFNLGYIRTLLTGQAFKSPSFLSRIENFIAVYDLSNQSMFFGNGVIDNQVEFFGSYLDSEIAVVFAQFGIIGLIIWFAFVCIMFMLSRNKHVENKVYFGMTLLFFGISFTNISFFNTQLGLLLFVCLGISISGDEKIECNANKKTRDKPS